jgi:hypothetical protein
MPLRLVVRIVDPTLTRDGTDDLIATRVARRIVGSTGTII